MSFFTSLRFRLGILVFVALVPAVLLTLYAEHAHRRSLREQSRREMAGLAELMAEKNEEVLQVLRALLTGLAETTPSSRADCEALYRRVMRESPGLINLGAVREDGAIVCSAAPMEGMVNVGDRDYFRRAREAGKFSVGNYQVGRVTGRPSLNAAVPRRGGGVVFGAIDLEWLGRSAVDASFPEGIVLSLVDEDGRLLARSPPAGDWIGKPLPDTAVLREALREGTSSGEFEGADGVPRFYVVRALRSAEGIFVAVGATRESMFAASERIFRRSLATLLGVILLALLACWAFGHLFISRGVSRLVTSVNAMGAGDLSARAAAERGLDELRDLGRAFNEMARSLGERERESRAARDSMERAQTAGRVGTWVADLVTGTRIRGSAEVFRIFEIEEAAFDGNPAVLLDRFSPEGREALGRAAAAAVEGEGVLDVQLRAAFPAGRVKWVHVRGEAVREDGRIVRLAGTVQDVSDRVRGEEERAQLEAQLRHAHKMEAVGRLAGGVAHDFNNLLTVILGFTNLVRARFSEKDPVAEDLQEVRNAAERATTLTRQLLAFSRRQVLSPRDLDLRVLVADMQKMLRRLIGEHIEVSMNCEEAVGLVHADPGQIEQVVMNLAVNARDAMPEGGRVTISLADETVGPENPVGGVPPGCYVRLSLADTGRGMTDEVKSRIFEPFYTTKQAGEGTGLGLATVYGIVHQSGGHITVDSAPGRGTRFDIYLPRLAEASAPASAAPPAAPRRGGSETVLVVEDEESVRLFISRVLASGGYRVIEARNGQEALAIPKETLKTVDLLLTDVIMPQMNGPEMVRSMALDLRRTRVLYMSGYTDEILAKSGIRENEANLLTKPFTPEVLLRRVREVLDIRPSR